jgi:3D (Asp-Asp-Asp) domain-containing protein
MKNKTNIFVLFCCFLPVLAYSEQFSQLPNNQIVTAYCGCEKCCGKWAKYNKTADGHIPKEGVTCAASRKIKFGTKLKIEGVGIRIVQDRLAIKYDNRIDIYFSSHKRALEFGKKKLKVEIIK